MKAYSLDFREKIVAAHIEQNISIRQVAAKFSVSKSLVQKLVKQQRVEGDLRPKKPGKPQFSHVQNAQSELRALVAENADATLVELCELFAQKTGNWVSRTAMCDWLQKLELNRKKRMRIAPRSPRRAFAPSKNDEEQSSSQRKSPEIKIPVLEKNTVYRARKLSILR